MASISKPFATATASATGDFSQKMNLSSSVPIRAPLTLDDSDSDLSSDLTFSDTSSHSDLEQQPHYASPEDEEDEECFELENELSIPVRVVPFAHLSTFDDDEDEDEEDDGEMFFSAVRDQENHAGVHRIMAIANELVFSDDTGSDVSIEAENEISCGGGGIEKEMDVEANDSDVISWCSEDGMKNEQFGKVRVAFNEFENDEMKLYGLDRNDEIRVELIDTDSVMQRKLEVDNTETTVMVEETSGSGGDSDVTLRCSEESLKNNEQFGKVRVEFNDFENDDMELYGLDRNDEIRVELIDTDSVMLRKLEVDNTETTETTETSGSGGLLESDAEGFSDGVMLEQNQRIGESNAENIEYSTATIQNNAVHGSEGVAASNQDSVSSITESVVDSKAILYDSSVGFESSGDACEGNKIQGVEYSEFSDPSLVEEFTYLEKGLSKTVLGALGEDELFSENVELNSANEESSMELNSVSQESKGAGSALDKDVEEMMLVRVEQLKEQIAALSILLGSKASAKNSHDDQIVREPHGRVNLPNDDVRSQLGYFDSGGESDCNSDEVTFADKSGIHFLEAPYGFSSLRGDNAQAWFEHNISESEKEKVHKIQTISVNFLMFVQRINFSLEDSLVSKVLCRLVADFGRRSHQEFVLRSAKILANKLEKDFDDDLDFSLNILVLGKSGVGKSATINSIFGDRMAMTDAFEPATTSVREVSGTIDGVKIRILDTPGLRSSIKEQAFNRKILSSAKKYMKKFPLDAILYVDRVDIQTRDLNDLPMLRTITNSLSPSIWRHTILTLTHAASTPLDGPSGSPTSYESFVAQKSHLFQQSIIKAVGDMRELSSSFMCPVSLIENHPLCEKNMFGDCVLPNGDRWRSKLLALCFSLKILSQLSSISIPCSIIDHWKNFLFQDHSQPLCHPCSCLLQSPAHHLKFSANWN